MASQVEGNGIDALYGALLVRAGAEGLSRQDVIDLIPGLKAIDHKIALLRKASLRDGKADDHPQS